uniref:Uncharacterized protein n=1 Tax=Lactuca sativa TaxID=4236 RepID=A0A9R1W5Y8_LACSA|nr:hypothetical protein LSAT_V11C300126790 [Lactuca sativa]
MTQNSFFTPQACKLKIGDAKGALLDTEFALCDGGNNAKAWFRQGQVGESIRTNPNPLCRRSHFGLLQFCDRLGFLQEITIKNGALFLW